VAVITYACHSREGGNPEGRGGGGFRLGGRNDIFHMITGLIGLFALLVFTGGYTLAQVPVSIEWEVYTTPEAGWAIGDPITLSLVVISLPEIDVSVPQLPSEWGPFEVREQALLEPIPNDDGTVTVIREATIIPWSTGELETPPTAIHYRDSNDEMHEEHVTALSITVGSILTEGDVEKRDLKPQASLDLAGPAIWPWILGGIVAVIVLAVALWWLWRSWRNREVSKPEFIGPVDDRFPEEIAYDELDRVVEINLPGKGEFKRHYEMVTDCMRTYLEGIYKIPAMEQTTTEIMTSVQKLSEPQSNEIAPSLRSLLEEADLVKFAKFNPTIDNAGNAVSDARRMVDITKPDRTTVSDEIPEPITRQDME